MKKNQEDMLNMFQAVDDVLQANNAVWTANVPFSDAVTSLEAGIDAIENLRDLQDVAITGITEDKQIKRQKLEDLTFLASGVIAFYASTINNRELMDKVKFTRSALTLARDNELPGMSVQVHQEAVAHAADVLPFGLTAGNISSLGTAIDEFTTYISKPRAALSETSAATEQLPPVFDAVNKVLEEQLDGGMEIYRTSDPAFYAAYHNARVIVNSPTNKRALEATFVEDVTAVPIAHVNVIVDDTIRKRSSELGNIRIQNLTEGSHTIKGQLPGYVNVSQNFFVISGETTKLTITMVRV